MAEIDIFNSERRYENAVKRLKESGISQRNKELILGFANDCLIGWGGVKIKKLRAVKYICLLKVLAEILEKEFDYVDKEDVKRLLHSIDSDSRKGDWVQHDYRIALRKFVKWLREEHGYPKDYPNGKYLTKILPLIKYPEEVSKVKVKNVDKIKPREEIPTQEETRYLREAAINARDKAFFAVSEELGPRIGGIGTRKIKHVSFDDLGAKIYMQDKTMKGEPTRLISSASYLRDWLEAHPFKHDPEAPLWINLERLPKCEALDYAGFRSMIRRTVKRHNTRAEKFGLPKITRRIHSHGFRYFAQIRDELEGVPRSVQKKQRGWSTDSNQPDRYAAIVTKDVDEYYRKKFGLNGSDNNSDKPIPCPRCKEVNFPKTLYCKRCGLPLDEKARKYDTVIDDLIEQIILDPELSQRLREKLLELKSGGENEA
ncbi:MAG: hypothetical protein ABH874_07155 [Methanobacteriota archaeon]